MTLNISSVFTYDEDAGNYIQRVEGASGDNQALEPATRQAINNFVIGCKQDGIWDAIKASCILAGARTLDGALVPLVGTAPTENGTAGGWNYNRKTGLQGDGTTNYLDSNRTLNADPVDSFHMGFYASSGTGLMGRGDSIGDNMIRGDNAVRARSSASYATQASSAPYYIAVSRPDSSIFNARVDGTAFSFSRASANTDTSNCMIFKHNNFYANGRLAFYSIGEALDLAKLDARVTDLITAFGAAIP